MRKGAWSSGAYPYGISYYILGYPAIILYLWLLTCYFLKLFLSNSSKRKHVLCLSFTDFTGIKANQRHGLALFGSLSMDKHHCTMLSCCTSWPPHTCMMQSDAKIQEAACSFPMMIMPRANWILVGTLSEGTLSDAKALFSESSDMSPAQICWRLRVLISLAEWRKGVKPSALAHSKPPLSAKQRSLDPLGHIWSISNMTKWPWLWYHVAVIWFNSDWSRPDSVHLDGVRPARLKACAIGT